jgi:hypothetical protein
VGIDGERRHRRNCRGTTFNKTESSISCTKSTDCHLSSSTMETRLMLSRIMSCVQPIAIRLMLNSMSVIIAGILGFVARHFADLSSTSSSNKTALLSEGILFYSFANYRSSVMLKYIHRNESIIFPVPGYKLTVH